MVEVSRQKFYQQLKKASPNRHALGSDDIFRIWETRTELPIAEIRYGKTIYDNKYYLSEKWNNA